MKSTVTNISSSSQIYHTGSYRIPLKKGLTTCISDDFFPSLDPRASTKTPLPEHPASRVQSSQLRGQPPWHPGSGRKMAIVQHDRKSRWDQFANDKKWLFNLKGVRALSWKACLLDCIIKWCNTFMDTNRLFHEMTNKVGQFFHAFKYVKPFNYVVMPYIKFLITSPHSNGWKVGTPRKWSIENHGNLRLEKWCIPIPRCQQIILWIGTIKKGPQSYCPNMCNFSLPYTFGHGKVDRTCQLRIGIGPVLLWT